MHVFTGNNLKDSVSQLFNIRMIKTRKMKWAEHLEKAKTRENTEQLCLDG